MSLTHHVIGTGIPESDIDIGDAVEQTADGVNPTAGGTRTAYMYAAVGVSGGALLAAGGGLVVVVVVLVRRRQSSKLYPEGRAGPPANELHSLR